MAIAIELKSIRVDQRASRGTHSYSAKLFVDGRHVADVGNDGNGGADRLLAPGRGIAYGDAVRMYDEASKRVVAELPKQDLADPGEEPRMVDDSLEYLCARIVSRHLLGKDLARLLKRQVAYYQDGVPAPGARASLFAYRLDRPLETIAARIRLEAPNAAILNEMETEAAIDAYSRSA